MPGDVVPGLGQARRKSGGRVIRIFPDIGVRGKGERPHGASKFIEAPIIRDRPHQIRSILNESAELPRGEELRKLRADSVEDRFAGKAL